MYELLCFGRICIENGVSEEVSLRSQKHLALLVYLASWPRRRHPREQLAALFWDTEPRLARHSLSQALYDIRKTLPELGLEATVQRVRLPEESGLTFEAREFERAIRENELARAVELYEGDFAPDLEVAGTSRFARWVEEERHRLRLEAEAVLHRYVRTSDSKAHWGQMFLSARKLLRMDALNEEAHRALMRGLWLQGDQASALRHFERERDFLARELPDGISDETMDLVDRIRSSRPGANDRIVEHGAPAEMIGREEEFELLQERVRALAAGGDGGFVIVRGEAGLGKTRLLEELTDVATLEEVRVLESRCYAAESAVAFGPVVDGLASVAADRADAEELRYYQLGHLFPTLFGEPDREADPYGAPAAGRRRLFEEAVDLVHREVEHRPLLWVVEDVHWIDSSSAALLHHLLRRLRGRAFLLIASVRAFEQIRSTAAELLAGRDDPVDRLTIDLDPLSLEETGALLEQLEEGLAERVDCRAFHRLSGGNPYYLVELARVREEVGGLGGGDSEPGALGQKAVRGKVGAVIHRRLRGLSPGALRILEVAAVAGRKASAPLVAAASGLELTELNEPSRELYAHGLLEDVDGRIQFLHDITREYVYGKMGGLQRSALHLAVGETLASGEAAVEPGVLAHHFRAANDSARAYEYAILAAREFRESQGHEEAISHAEFALKAANGAEERTAALEILSQAELAVGNLVQAQSYLEDLIHLGSLPPRETTSIRLDLIHAHVEQSDWEGAIEQLDELDHRLEKVDPEARLEAEMRALYFRLKVAMRRRDHATATGVAKEFRRRRESSTSVAKSLVATGLAGISLGTYALFYRTASEARQEVDKLRKIEGQLPDELWIRSRLLQGTVAVKLGRWDEAEYCFRSALERASAKNAVLLKGHLLNNLSCVALEQGDWSRFEELYQEIEQLYGSLPQQLFLRLSPKLNYANSLWYSGRLRKSQELYHESWELVDRFEGEASRPDLEASLALTHLQAGEEGAGQKYARLVNSYEWSSLRGVQDRFKIVWIQAYTLWQSDPEAAYAKLKQRIVEEERRDQVSALKLKIIHDELQTANSSDRNRMTEVQDHKLESLVREMRLGWFVYFFKRWLRQVDQKSRSSLT